MNKGALVRLKKMSDWEMYGMREHDLIGIVLGMCEPWDLALSYRTPTDLIGYRVLWHDGSCDVYWEHELRIISDAGFRAERG